MYLKNDYLAKKQRREKLNNNEIDPIKAKSKQQANKPSNKEVWIMLRMHDLVGGRRWYICSNMVVWIGLDFGEARKIPNSYETDSTIYIPICIQVKNLTLDLLIRHMLEYGSCCCYYTIRTLFCLFWFVLCWDLFVGLFLGNIAIESSFWECDNSKLTRGNLINKNIHLIYFFFFISLHHQLT